MKLCLLHTRVERGLVLTLSSTDPVAERHMLCVTESMEDPVQRKQDTRHSSGDYPLVQFGKSRSPLLPHCTNLQRG